jgi:hypothetical protein
VINSTGSVPLATTSGRNGTSGSRASAARTPISRTTRSAAGRDQANFAMNRSPTTALDDHHSGSALAAGPGTGTVTGHRLSSGATAFSASRTAAAEHAASHFIPGTLPRRLLGRRRSRTGTGTSALASIPRCVISTRSWLSAHRRRYGGYSHSPEMLSEPSRTG